MEEIQFFGIALLVFLVLIFIVKKLPTKPLPAGGWRGKELPKNVQVVFVVLGKILLYTLLGWGIFSSLYFGCALLGFCPLYF